MSRQTLWTGVSGRTPSLTGLVKYSVAMVNRCRRGPDGKTAHEMREGRKFGRALPHFAEKILFMICGVMKGVARVEPRWEDGIFLGVSTERGMHKVRTVRRREEPEGVDLTFLNSVSARPWDGPKKVRDVRIVLPDVSSPAAMAEAEAIGKGRRLYISKADLMKHGLTEGCLGCRCLAEGKRAQGHSEGCRARLEADIAKTEEGRARLTTAYLKGLPRDEGRGPGAGIEAPAAVPVPPRTDGVQDEPMNAEETSRKRSAENAGHEADDAGRGGAQPGPGSMVDDSMSELRREAEALGADAVALPEAYSPASRQRAGALGSSAGVAMDLRLGWDLGQRADQVKAEKRLNDEKLHLLILSPMCLALSRLQHAKPDELAELREQGKRHLEFACSPARLQIEQGGRVLFEYPLAASEEPCLWKLRSIDGMRCVRCDQCHFGMTSDDSEGIVGPACQATGFMTNDEYIAEAVNRHCFGGHNHIQSLSGRAKSCEKYSPTVGGSDTACFATEHASRGTRPSTENVGTRPTTDNRSSGGLADSGSSRVDVAPCQR